MSRPDFFFPVSLSFSLLSACQNDYFPNIQMSMIMKQMGTCRNQLFLLARKSQTWWMGYLFLEKITCWLFGKLIVKLKWIGTHAIFSRQAKKCAQTVVAPPPTKIKKVNLPSHFQFFNSDTSKVKDQASNEWRKGFSKPFKSYQKVVSLFSYIIQIH